MTNNVVSIDKSLNKEKSDFFDYHYDFLEDLLTYESLLKKYIGDVFDGKESDPRIKNKIKEIHKSVIWPNVFSVLAFATLILCITMHWVGLTPLVIIFGFISGVLWNNYTKQENEKAFIVDTIYNMESKNTILSNGYLISLKVFANEEVMMSLLKKYGKKIPYSEAVKIISPYHRSFENYKAVSLYDSIR